MGNWFSNRRYLESKVNVEVRFDGCLQEITSDHLHCQRWMENELSLHGRGVQIDGVVDLWRQALNSITQLYIPT